MRVTIANVKITNVVSAKWSGIRVTKGGLSFERPPDNQELYNLSLAFPRKGKAQGIAAGKLNSACIKFDFAGNRLLVKVGKEI